MKHEDKTNVIRLLEGKKIPYSSHSYNPDPAMTGEDISTLLNEPPSCVFKTLVTQGKNSTSHYVFIVPVNAELDLKKAAKAAGEKSVAMIKQKELLPLTGYVHGGCSPVGMKKQFPTFIHVMFQKHLKMLPELKSSTLIIRQRMQVLNTLLLTTAILLWERIT